MYSRLKLIRFHRLIASNVEYFNSSTIYNISASYSILSIKRITGIMYIQRLKFFFRVASKVDEIFFMFRHHFKISQILPRFLNHMESLAIHLFFSIRKGALFLIYKVVVVTTKTFYLLLHIEDPKF